MYSKLCEEHNITKAAGSFYVFLKTPVEIQKYVEMTQSNSSDNCIHHYNVKILYLFDPELQLIKTKSLIKSKLKKLLSELKKFNVQTALVLEYKNLP